MERLNEELANRGLADLPPERLEEALEVDMQVLQEPELEGARPGDSHPSVQHALEFVKDLLRYYRPTFDELPREEQIALMGGLCRRIHEALKAVKGVVEFAECGTPDGKLKPAFKNAALDIKAAELRDIGGLTYREIAEYTGEPQRSPSSEDKHDHPTTRGRVARGRKLLKQAYGDEGWSKLVESLREEASTFSKLSEEEKWLQMEAHRAAEWYGIPFDQTFAIERQYVEDVAEKLRIPFEEAVRYVRDAEPGHRHHLQKLGLTPPAIQYGGLVNWV